MKPADLNNGWRTIAVDGPAASGALSTPRQHPFTSLHPSLVPTQASMLLKPRPIEWAQALTPSAGGATLEAG